MSDKKVLLAIRDKAERVMAMVIQKYSKLCRRICGVLDASRILLFARKASID